jgi:hypothetical protein
MGKTVHSVELEIPLTRFAYSAIESMDFFHQKSLLIVKNSGAKIFLHNISIR